VILGDGRIRKLGRASKNGGLKMLLAHVYSLWGKLARAAEQGQLIVINNGPFS